MAGNCDVDEGGEKHVAENIDTAEHCDIDEGSEMHVAENVDMAGHCDIDKDSEMHVAENVDMAGHCDIDEGGEILVHVDENVDTAGNCDKNECDDIENESYTCESTSDKADFGYFHDETNFNDSIEDPEYVPVDSKDSDTTEEGYSASVTCSYRNRQQATSDNHYRKRSS
ncbi:hypothetical protein DPMN_109621 [Dreissena polymorpha]|uniref:Uncharacterized protein n=1 Tax=Dreissena polymorpha TaxID=45954 RepID=A0A9D4QM56_DREPO|nr:hypothetical protein DPMN_109621 [Dreissena polymorpha]